MGPNTGWVCSGEGKVFHLTIRDLSDACKEQQEKENAFAKDNGNNSWKWQCYINDKIK